MAIRKLFIANRGEIAVRIIRAAKSLGIETVQAHSEADAGMLAVQLADGAVCVGPAQAAKSYLNIAAVVAAAKDAGCDAVHPGYGFLAENAEFARAVEAAGMVFVGPTAETIDRMGDKVAAKIAAKAAGVPTVPGSDGRIEAAEAVAIAEGIGYPVMIKAAAGGGGRGIRIATSAEELARLAPQARAEAEAAFGDGTGAAVHCYERECSLQRRRQKVWEEAPAFGLPEATRKALCDSAVALAQAVNYRGAGTIEYLYDGAADRFYFIEMNTRIQVEHPVTEMVTGLDLVALMLRIAGGEPLPLTQEQITCTGHAIEVRLNAEDPFLQFLPFPGKVTALTIPVGEGVRFDHFLYEGYQIPPFYDSLLGKLIVRAGDRAAAIELMAETLTGIEIGGLKTTIPLHLALAADAGVRAGDFHTQWLEPWLAAGNLTAPTAA